MYRSTPFKPPRIGGDKRIADAGDGDTPLLLAKRVRLESSQSTDSYNGLNNLNSSDVKPTLSSKYSVLYRKKSNRKKKPWEDEGFLHVLSTLMTLKDEDGNYVSKKTRQPTDKIPFADVFTMGVYEVQIETEVVDLPKAVFKPITKGPEPPLPVNMNPTLSTPVYPEYLNHVNSNPALSTPVYPEHLNHVNSNPTLSTPVYPEYLNHVNSNPTLSTPVYSEHLNHVNSSPSLSTPAHLDYFNDIYDKFKSDWKYERLQSKKKKTKLEPSNSLSALDNGFNNLNSSDVKPTLSSKYSVLYRKKSNRKKKPWEDEGFLHVLSNLMTLKDEDGNYVSKKTRQPTDKIPFADVFTMGVYEVQIETEVVDLPKAVFKPITKGPEVNVNPTFSTPVYSEYMNGVYNKSQYDWNDQRLQSKQKDIELKPPNSLSAAGALFALAPTTNKSSTSSYLIQWRKKSNKKNKSWEGDGTLTALDCNGCITLSVKDLNGKSLGKKTFGPTIPPTFLGCTFSLGGIEFEVDEEFAEGNDGVQTTDNNSNFVSPQIENTAFKPVAVGTAPFTTNTPELESSALYTNPKAILLPKFDNCKVDVAVDSHLSVHLRPHQIEGVKFLYECVMGFRESKRTGCLLADEMGLGKTLMTITLIWTLLKQCPFKRGPTINKILIVCPVTLINNWVQEFKKWLGNNKVGILTLTGNTVSDRASIVNFEKLNVYQILIINYEKVGTYFPELANTPFDLLICDEGHRLKTSSNKVLNHLTNLKISKQILLTGTPIQNDLVEFYNIINFINPGILGDFKQFQKTYINVIVKSRDVHCFDNSLKKMGEELSNKLIGITKPFILRRTQAILSKYLTDKTDTIIFVPPTPLQSRLFDYILNLPTFSQEVNNSNQAFTLINLFKKLCNSPSLLSNDKFYTSIEDDKKNFQLTTSSGKINILIPLLLEITALNEKIVLISNYTKTLNLLELILKKLNLQFIRLDGSTPNAMRGKLVSAFNKTPSIHVFLLSSKSGGMGINLVGASRLILFDNDWNPAVDLQSMSRIHRDGQTKQCYIYRIMTTGCIDEKIFQRQLMKNNLSSTFLDNETKRSDNVFDEFEMKKLFEIDYNTSCNTHDLLDCNCGGVGNEQIEEADVTIEDESEEEDVLPQNSWVSAKELMTSMSESEQDQTVNKKSSMRNALSGYIHFDPAVANPDEMKDNVLKNILQNEIFKKTNGKLPISFIFSKPTSGLI